MKQFIGRTNVALKLTHENRTFQICKQSKFPKCAPDCMQYSI